MQIVTKDFCTIANERRLSTFKQNMTLSQDDRGMQITTHRVHNLQTFIGWQLISLKTNTKKMKLWLIHPFSLFCKSWAITPWHSEGRIQPYCAYFLRFSPNAVVLCSLALWLAHSNARAQDWITTVGSTQRFFHWFEARTAVFLHGFWVYYYVI